jgi:hypothetical protein
MHAGPPAVRSHPSVLTHLIPHGRGSTTLRRFAASIALDPMVHLAFALALAAWAAL